MNRDELKDRIYGLLFDRSRVDGVRIINEDEWPIDELAALFDAKELL